ncbi:hypothetical protein [Desulforamulus profundi]|uniref:hypothetical protein n=1 Tax=Desulforamulus profundi TaxID=1383067 RepID=UPI0015D4E6C4|nr:hypothetical protein [Desulforamulus profundi]
MIVTGMARPAGLFVLDDAILVVHIEMIDKGVVDRMALDAVIFGKIIVVAQPSQDGASRSSPSRE